MQRRRRGGERGGGGLEIKRGEGGQGRNTKEKCLHIKVTERLNLNEVHVSTCFFWQQNPKPNQKLKYLMCDEF